MGIFRKAATKQPYLTVREQFPHHKHKYLPNKGWSSEMKQKHTIQSTPNTSQQIEHAS